MSKHVDMVIHRLGNELVLRSSMMDPNVEPQHNQLRILRTQTESHGISRKSLLSTDTQKTGSRCCTIVTGYCCYAQGSEKKWVSVLSIQF